MEEFIGSTKTSVSPVPYKQTNRTFRPKLMNVASDWPTRNLFQISDRGGIVSSPLSKLCDGCSQSPPPIAGLTIQFLDLHGSSSLHFTSLSLQSPSLLSSSFISHDYLQGRGVLRCKLTAVVWKVYSILSLLNCLLSGKVL